MDYNTFANNIKQKYPQYKDEDNLELAKKVVEKYPIYQKQVDIPKQGLVSKIGQTLNESGDKSEAIIKDNNRGVISRGVGATAQGFKGAMGVLGDVISSIPGAKTVGNVLKPVVNTIGTRVSSVVDTIADNKYAQAYSKDLARSLGGEENVQTLADAGGIADTILGAQASGKALVKTKDIAQSGVNKTIDVAQKGVETITTKATDVIDRISSPNVSDATRVSLNPVEALKGTGQDMRVTVGGKSKMVSELTPDEISKLKVSTGKSIDTFTEQAKLFKNDRSVAKGSPVEVVGSRTDNALQFADKKRQAIGQRMGEIETKYADEIIPNKPETIQVFNDIKDLANKPSYGAKLNDSPLVQKLIEDFDTLAQNGLSIAERNKFVRSWDSVIRDAKDAFGNFKENGSVYTKIQNAVNKVKDETVTNLTNKDNIYRGLRSKYAEHIKLQDFGDALLGKDGALGERIKGAATVKRAIQSNSDAGARQFLAKLKEITGYDAIRDGDLALTAMKNVGDYQGLSLLNILQEGKGGIIKSVLEKGQDMLVGNEAKRVKKFIKK